MKKLLYLVIGVCYTSLYFTQMAAGQSGASWGQPSCGVQMSALLTNNVVKRGETISVQCSITNSSSNVISAIMSTPSLNFDVTIQNSAGKPFDITINENKREVISRIVKSINPNETGTLSFPIAIGTNFEPGMYSFVVKRSVFVESKGCEISAKPIIIELK